jgi:hypothetical protein
MSHDRETNRIVRSWLETGVTALPDRVLDDVLDQLHATPQRRAPWPARRLSDMNRTLTFGAAAAAVVAVVLIGTALFASPGTGMGNPGDEPTPNPTATPMPSASAVESSPEPTTSAAAGLPVGTSFALSADESIAATIPAPGWSVDLSGTGTLAKPDGSGPDGAYVFGPWIGDPLIPGDPCRWESTMPDTPATTLDEIVAALASQATRNASEPVDVTVDGYAGKSITIEMPDGPYTASDNPDCDQRKFCTLSFEDPADCHMWHQEVGQVDELWIVDVDGEFYFMDGAYYAETPASVVGEIGALLGSMTFGE